MAGTAVRALLIGGVLAATTAPALAQMSVPGMGNFSRMRQHFSTRAAERAGLPQRPTRPSTPRRPAAPASTAFRPQAAELAPALMAAEGNRTTAEQASLRQQYSDLLFNYRNRLRASGGPQHDVARAAAYLASASHGVYFGHPPMSLARFSVLRRQFEREFLASAEFRRKSDRQRQIEFEIYAILGTLVDVLSVELASTGDPAVKARDAAQLRKLARELRRPDGRTAGKRRYRRRRLPPGRAQLA